MPCQITQGEDSIFEKYIFRYFGILELIFSFAQKYYNEVAYMTFSKTTEYAIRILTYMATDYEKLYSAKSIVEKLKIPNKYMRRIMTNLSKSNFILSIQGREGGYKFLKSPENIYLSEIIDSVDGMDKYMGCVLGFNECSAEKSCAMHNSWIDTRDRLYSTLTKTNLKSLINKSINKF